MPVFGRIKNAALILSDCRSHHPHLSTTNQSVSGFASKLKPMPVSGRIKNAALILSDCRSTRHRSTERAEHPTHCDADTRMHLCARAHKHWKQSCKNRWHLCLKRYPLPSSARAHTYHTCHYSTHYLPIHRQASNVMSCDTPVHTCSWRYILFLVHLDQCRKGGGGGVLT